MRPFPPAAHAYSTAKTAFAGIALMYLVQRFGSRVASLPIADYLPEARAADRRWGEVSFENALDMATGRYRSPNGLADEDDRTTERDFFGPEATRQKLRAALDYPRKEPPGRRWIYHTTDTFLLTLAMDRFLKSRLGEEADIFRLVRDEVFAPLGLSAGVSTLRTGNSEQGAPFGGYGLFWTVDDIVKVAHFMNSSQGWLNGRQLLDPLMLAGALQRADSDPGLSTGRGPNAFRYNNGVWAFHYGPRRYPIFSRPFWVPFMSGYGGIRVALMPNGIIFYYFSDNNEFVLDGAVLEAHKLLPQGE